MATVRQVQQFPCITCPLLACEGLRAPDPAQREWLQTFKSGEIRVGKGDAVLTQGSWSTGVFTLLSGMLVRYRLLEDGRRQIINFMFPGDLVGLQGAFDDPLLHGADALTPAILCHFPRDRFFDLVNSHPRLSFDVTWLAAKEEAALEEHIVSLGQRSAREPRPVPRPARDRYRDRPRRRAGNHHHAIAGRRHAGPFTGSHQPHPASSAAGRAGKLDPV